MSMPELKKGDPERIIIRFLNPCRNARRRVRQQLQEVHNSYEHSSTQPTPRVPELPPHARFPT
jgi:hypothetical protein